MYFFCVGCVTYYCDYWFSFVDMVVFLLHGLLMNSEFQICGGLE